MDSKRYVPAAVGFERINKEPLDKYEVFDSINELKDYVNFGPVYYGQVCVVRFSDGVSLSYSIGKNKTINPILPFENHIMHIDDISKYGYTNSITSVSNNSERTKWQLLYNYDPDSEYIYFSREGYNTHASTLSLLHNLDLYNYNGNYNFLIIINGEIKYKWTQNINFMTSNSTSETGACIKHTPDDSTYICPLIVDDTLTNYGLFPKKQTTDYISLYIGV